MNMTTPTRTPEGSPHECSICGKKTALEPSIPVGDAVCSRCGHLLMWFQKQIAGSFSLSPEQVTPNVSFTEDLQADSLDVVELMMELEEEFEIEIPDEDFDKIKTVGDAIRYIEHHSHAREGGLARLLFENLL